MTGAPDLDELRDVMRSQATSLPDNVDREHDVHDRVMQHKRRRRVAGAAGSVVLAAAATFSALTWLPDGRDAGVPKPAPIVSGTQDQPLPEYLRGGRLIASNEGVSARGISVTFTPTSPLFGFALSCVNTKLARERQPKGAAMAMTSINGTPALGVSCGETLSLDGDSDFGRRDSRWVQDYGVVIGQPTTVRFAFDKGGVHPGTHFRIGVYQGVPVSEYPFPPEPAHLTHLSGMSHPPGRLVLDSSAHPSDPAGWSYTVPVQHGLTVVLQTAAPGVLRMYSGDRLVWTSRSWTYDLAFAQGDIRLSQLGISPGQKVTLRFEADRFPPDSYRYQVYDRSVN